MGYFGKCGYFILPYECSPIVRPPTNSFGGIIYYVVGRRIPSNCSRILTFLKTPRILPCGHSGHKLVDLKKALAKITSKEGPRENQQHFVA